MAGMFTPWTLVLGDNYSEDMDAVMVAIEKAKKETGKPSLITLRTIIGWPSPTKQNTGGIHGSALGADEVAGAEERARTSRRPGVLRACRSVGTHPWSLRARECGSSGLGSTLPRVGVR